MFGNDLFRNSLCRQLLNYVSAPVLYLCSLILAMLIIVNILACIMIFIAELEGEQNSWMGAAGALRWSCLGGGLLFVLDCTAEDAAEGSFDNCNSKQFFTRCRPGSAQLTQLNRPFCSLSV